MERDFNLIRQILLEIESAPPGRSIQELVCNGFDKFTIVEHVEIMIDAKLLDGTILKTMIPPSKFLIHKITWEGHDFLANAKNDTVWKKVMAEAKDKGMSTSMVVINALLAKFALKYAGLG